MTEPAPRKITSFEEMMEKRQALQEILDGARSAGLDPGTCDLAARLLDETFEQVENVAALGGETARQHQAVSRENARLATENAELWEAALAGKSFAHGGVS